MQQTFTCNNFDSKKIHALAVVQPSLLPSNVCINQFEDGFDETLLFSCRILNFRNGKLCSNGLCHSGELLQEVAIHLFHSPDSSAPDLRTQKFGLVERNKQDFFNLFLVVYSLSGSLEMFHNGESWKWNCWWFHRPDMQRLFSGPFQKVIGCEGTRYNMQWSIW